MKNKMAKPTDECTCGHMLKSHKTTFRFSNKRKQQDVRIKCRYCKCNLLLEPYKESK